MRTNISEPTTRMIAFILAFVTLVAGSVVGYLWGGLLLAAGIEIGLLAAMYVLRSIVTPAWSTAPDWRYAALGIFAAAASSFGLWEPFVVAALVGLWERLGFRVPNLPSETLQVLVLTMVGVFLVSFVAVTEKRSIVLKPSSDNVDDPFPIKDYTALRDEFCRYMVGVLDGIDRDVNWSDSYFTRLEAEIEFDRSGTQRIRVVRDMVSAIRADRSSRCFVLIGDPGSGKSVSLRRLARELYSQVNVTGVVPIYINLREWDGPKQITDPDISDFVFRYVSRLAARSGQTFLQTWYEGMLSRGLFFFILDSFDELPAVLDCDDQSSEVKAISLAFDRFMHDIHRCRSVLSSRPFRQPVGVRGRRLVIRPYTERQIRNAFQTLLRGHGLDTDALLRNLLRKRPELSSALRNPFMADLVAQYLMAHPSEVPASYFDLYDHYVTQRLRVDLDQLRTLGLSSSEVIDCATTIAWIMYKSPSIGLEAELQDLARQILDPRLTDKVNAMAYSRLVRLGGGSKTRLSFVHRRFAEYFAVRALEANQENIDLQAIPTDSRWRDALVVYIGIAPLEQCVAFANYAWAEVVRLADTLLRGDVQQARSAVHCLRFLRDAFQARPQAIEPLRPQLSAFVLQAVQSDDVVVVKFVTELLPLVNPDARPECLARILAQQVPWLSEAMFRSCRYMDSLDDDAIDALRYYLCTLPVEELVWNFRDLSFGLSLSDALKPVLHSLRLDLLSLACMAIVWIGSAFFSVVLYVGADRDPGLYLVTISPFFVPIMTMFVVFFLPMFGYAEPTYWIPDRLIPFTSKITRGILDRLPLTTFDSLSEVEQLRITRGFVKRQFKISRPFPGGASRNGPSSWLRPSLTMGIIFQLIQLLRMAKLDYPLLLWTTICFLLIMPWEVWAHAIRVIWNPYLISDWARRDAFPIIKPMLTVRGLAELSTLLLVGFGGYVVLNNYNIVCLAVILPISSVLFLGALVSVVRQTVLLRRDRLKLQELRIDKRISWEAICHSASQYETGWGQSSYLEWILTQKIEIVDYSDSVRLSVVRGRETQASEGRLREYALGLNE